MKKAVIIIILLLLSLFISACTQELQDMYHETENENRISFTKLDNGISVIIKEEHKHSKVATFIGLDMGASDERPDEKGLAHFVEHMFFKTIQARYNESWLDFLSKMGVSDFNAMTSPDDIVFYFVSLPEEFNETMGVFSGMMLDPIFREDDLRKERGVVYEEYTGALNNPYTRFGERFDALFYEDHPYSEPVIGYPEVFMECTAEDVRAFQQRVVAPSNMYIAVVGDVDTQETIELITELFGSAKPRDSDMIEKPIITTLETNTTETMPLEVSQKSFMIGFRIPGNISEKDDYALMMFSFLLDEKLLYEMTYEGIVLDAYSLSYELDDDNSIIISITVEEGMEDIAFETMWDILDSFKRGDIDSDKFNNIKNGIIRTTSKMFYTDYDQAEMFVHYAMDEQIENEDEMNKIYDETSIIENVSEKDIEDIANRYFNNYVMLIAEPER